MCPIGFISRNYDSQSKAVEEYRPASEHMKLYYPLDQL
jgi:hypothetical protein